MKLILARYRRPYPKDYDHFICGDVIKYREPFLSRLLGGEHFDDEEPDVSGDGVADRVMNCAPTKPDPCI